MTQIEFYYDPSCPFCWITSRWLLQVERERDIDITWRPFSLAMKNDELGTPPADAYAASHVAAHRVLRVIDAATEQGASAVDLYSAFGRRKHVQRGQYDDAVIAEVLADAGLPADLASAADDTARDEHLRAEMQSALDVLGDDVGVPIVVFVREDGTRQGYFGPVLNEMPGRQEAFAIWDGLERLATVSAFYELKRTRTGAPDVASTAGH